jgi:hypothetical protein
MKTLGHPKDQCEIIDLFNYNLGQQIKLFLVANRISFRQLAAELDIPPRECRDLLNGGANEDGLCLVLFYLNKRHGLDVNSLLRGTAGFRVSPGTVTSK